MRLGWVKESYKELIEKYLEVDKARCIARKKYNATPSDRIELLENYRVWLPLNISANMYT
jgi:hypothetical protein